MKKLKIFLLFISVSIFAGLSTAMAQEKTPEEIKKMVESQSFVFKAEIAYPQGGNSRSLTSDYDLTVRSNNVVSVLPYFGTAYTASIDPAESGIKFTSTDFEYLPEQNDKGWEITIKPKDAKDVQKMYLNIFSNGSASLEVVNITRQSISFSGYIK